MQFLILISSIKTNHSKDIFEKKKDWKPSNNTALNALGGVKQDESSIYNTLVKYGKYRGTIQFGQGLINTPNKKAVMTILQEFFSNAERPILYYSGHGSRSGAMVLQTNKGIEFIEPNQLYQLYIKHGLKTNNLILIIDCCYSGNWISAYPSNISDILVFAACSENEVAYDEGPGNGGAFTRIFIQLFQKEQKHFEKIYNYPLLSHLFFGDGFFHGQMEFGSMLHFIDRSKVYDLIQNPMYRDSNLSGYLKENSM